MTKKEQKPKELKPWDRRPWPPAGDRYQGKLYEAVGRALSEWERYEATLAFLFANFVSDGNNWLPARRAYSAVRTFEGRTAMLRAASEAFFHEFGEDAEHLLDDFKDVLRDATRYSERRNEITHAAVEHYIREDATNRLFEIDPNSYALFPAFATVKDRNVEGFPGYCYTSAELEYFRKEFYLLAKPVRDLAGKVSTVRQLVASRGKLRRLYRATTNQAAEKKDQTES